MLRPGGFPEYTPGVQQIFDTIKEIIKHSYKQFGYVPIWTPAVEKNSVLCKGSENSVKQIFGLYGFAQGASDIKDYSLHFDLTVPFARYVLDHQNELTFPFKRSQIQPVWRGERRQRGRFNEFWQADIDVIWPHKKDSKNENWCQVGEFLRYDAEILYVLATTLYTILRHFNITKSLVVKINNRKIMEGFFGNICSPQKKQDIFALLDDYYKLPNEIFYTKLSEIIEEDSIVEKIKAFLTISSMGGEIFYKPLEEIKEFFEEKVGKDVFSGDNGLLFYTGIKELTQVFTYLALITQENKNKFVYDPFIIRGLDYYTGIVFETYFSDDISLGSICSGGRYEGLTQTIEPQGIRYDGVGGSIGLSRLCTLLLDEKLLSPTKETSTEYLFIHFPTTIKETLNLMQTFLQQGRACEFYPIPEKIAKQLTYANKKGIRYVVLLGSNEIDSGSYIIKDMMTGKEISQTLPS